MTRTVDDAIAEVKACARGWTRFEGQEPRDSELLVEEIERLRRDCGEAYQAIGAMANALGWWQMSPEHPWHRPIEKLLDNIGAAGDAEPRPHDDLLPFALDPELSDANRLRAALSLAYAAIREAPDHRVSTGWRMRWAKVLKVAQAAQKGGDAK